MLKYKFLYDKKWVCVYNQLESKMVQSLAGDLYRAEFKIKFSDLYFCLESLIPSNLNFSLFL